MRVCIVGSGKVGYYLAKNFIEHGHEPIIIEMDKSLATRAANNFDIPVIHGDGTRVETLRLAGVAECTALVSVTGKDENNLIACQLAKKVFHVKKTIARVNNPKNVAVLKTLGVDIVVSGTENITMILERETEAADVRLLLSLDNGNSSLSEMVLPENFRYTGKMLSELRMPKDTIVVTINHNDELIIPCGSTKLFPKDKVMVISKDSALHELAEQWDLTELTAK